MRIVLLGGGGFIGSHLAEWLLRGDVHDVIATDINHENVRHLLDQRRFTYFDSDIHKDRELTNELIVSSDLVVNLIAIPTSSAYSVALLHEFEVDLVDNLRIARLCAQANRRLIQFSSCEVYGPTWLSLVPPELATPEFIARAEVRQSEEATSLISGPIHETRWLDAASRHLLERAVHALGVQEGLDYSVIRPFDVIGPRIDLPPSGKGEESPRMFAQFMDALVHGTRITLVDGGTARRCYTYIDDAIEGIGRVIEDSTGVTSRQIFNIGNPRNEASIAEFAALMGEIYHERYWDRVSPHSEVISVPGTEFFGPGYAECDRRSPDISKANALLGWEPRWGLRALVEATMDSFVRGSRIPPAPHPSPFALGVE